MYSRRPSKAGLEATFVGTLWLKTIRLSGPSFMAYTRDFLRLWKAEKKSRSATIAGLASTFPGLNRHRTLPVWRPSATTPPVPSFLRPQGAGPDHPMYTIPARTAGDEAMHPCRSVDHSRAPSLVRAAMTCPSWLPNTRRPCETAGGISSRLSPRIDWVMRKGGRRPDVTYRT